MREADEQDGSGSEPLFHRDGTRLVPTPMTQGPWNPEHQHGGAVAAALAWALERHPTPVPMRPVRIVFDLMHPAPLRPLRPEVRVARAGRRVQLLDAVLLEGERAVARATALLLRSDPDVGLGDEARGPRSEPLASRPGGGVPPSAPAGLRSGFAYLPGFLRAVDFERAQTSPRTGEAARAWTRLRVPAVDGEPASPLVRLAAAADFTSALGVGLDFARFVAINPDVTLHIERLPGTEWIGLETGTRIAADGIGTSSGTLYDLDGPVARAHTSLYVGARPAAQPE